MGPSGGDKRITGDNYYLILSITDLRVNTAMYHDGSISGHLVAVRM